MELAVRRASFNNTAKISGAQLFRALAVGAHAERTLNTHLSRGGLPADVPATPATQRALAHISNGDHLTCLAPCLAPAHPGFASYWPRTQCARVATLCPRIWSPPEDPRHTDVTAARLGARAARRRAQRVPGTGACRHLRPHTPPCQMSDVHSVRLFACSCVPGWLWACWLGALGLGQAFWAPGPAYGWTPNCFALLRALHACLPLQPAHRVPNLQGGRSGAGTGAEGGRRTCSWAQPSAYRCQQSRATAAPQNARRKTSYTNSSADPPS